MNLYVSHDDKRGYWDVYTMQRKKCLFDISSSGSLSEIEKLNNPSGFFLLSEQWCICCENDETHEFFSCSCGLTSCCVPYWTKGRTTNTVVQENGIKRFLTILSACYPLGGTQKYLFEQTPRLVLKKQNDEQTKLRQIAIKIAQREKELKLQRDFEALVLELQEERQASVFDDNLLLDSK